MNRKTASLVAGPRLLLLVVLAWLLAACGPGDDPAPPGVLNTSITAPVAGTAGQPLRDPVVLRVVKEDGEAAPGVAVLLFAPDSGRVTPLRPQWTDALGEVRFTWTLGPATGEQRVLALVAGQTVVPIVLESLSGPVPHAIRVVSGDNQTVAMKCQSPDVVTFEVTDADGAPAPGAPVVFGGGAVAEPTTAITDAEGRASARWTMPASIGNVRLEASVFPVSEAAVAHARSRLREPRVELVAGEGQAAVQHQMVAQALVLRLVDECDGTPWARHPLEWSKPMPVKSPSHPTYFTDSAGYAEWRGYLHDAGNVGVSAAILLSHQSARFTVHVAPAGQRFDGDYVLDLRHPVYQDLTLRRFTFGVRDSVIVPTGGDPVASASLLESDGTFRLISTTGFYLEGRLFFSGSAVLGGGDYGIGRPPDQGVPGVSRADWSAARF